MAKTKKAATVDYQDTIRDIYDNVQESGTTRADMEDTLDTIADLCVDALPDLKSPDDEDEAEDEDEDDEDQD